MTCKISRRPPVKMTLRQNNSRDKAICLPTLVSRLDYGQRKQATERWHRPMAANDTELIDIYDGNRRPTGQVVPRRGTFLKEGQYMLYVLALIQDREGQFLITQRTLNKKWAAGWWEVTGGGAAAGETSAQAVTREVREEVGLDVSHEDLTPVYSYENVDLKRGDNYFVDIYHFRMDFTLADITLQKSEAIGVRLATLDQIALLDVEGHFLHYQRIIQALNAEYTKYEADGDELARAFGHTRGGMDDDDFEDADDLEDANALGPDDED